MQISDIGIDLVKTSELLRLDSYQDSVGVWTIGWGRTGPDIGPDMHITVEQAEKYFIQNVEVVEKCINNCVSVALTQGQFDALCSFVFNLGCIALRNSTLLRKLNEGDDVGAAEEFKRWNHAGGQVLAGLTTRRKKEEDLFLA